MSIVKRQNKAGTVSYELRISNGRGKKPFTRNVPAPTQKTFSELRKIHKRRTNDELTEIYLKEQMAAFEADIASGGYLTKAEREAAAQAAAQAAAREAAAAVTMRQFVEAVIMPQKCDECSINTVLFYQSRYKELLSFKTSESAAPLGDCLVADVTSAQLTALFSDMLRRGLTRATRSTVRVALAQLFKAARAQGIRADNPLDLVAAPKATRNETAKKADRKTSLTPDEVEVIREAMESKPLVWRCLIDFLFASGCRRGEALGVRWSDIDRRNGSVTLRTNIQPQRGGGVREDVLKNGKARNVYISAEMLSELDCLRKAQKVRALSDFVFQERGKVISPTRVTAFFSSLREETGIKDLHTHLSRHTFATLALGGGAAVTDVSLTLGHSSPVITLGIYAHASEEGQRHAAAIVADTLKRKKA